MSLKIKTGRIRSSSKTETKALSYTFSLLKFEIKANILAAVPKIIRRYKAVPGGNAGRENSIPGKTEKGSPPEAAHLEINFYN